MAPTGDIFPESHRGASCRVEVWQPDTWNVRVELREKHAVARHDELIAHDPAAEFWLRSLAFVEGGQAVVIEGFAREPAGVD